MKKGILLLILLLVGCSSNPAGIDSDIYEESKEIFDMVETAYEEERELTENERNEIRRFKEKINELEEKEEKGNLSDRGFENYAVMWRVEAFADFYPVITMREDTPEELWNKFNDRYEQAEKALENGVDIENE
ncbi:hypothetical protein SAMN05192534_12455 [Alteribacillus persepolensis]|uniref:Uncharacterized protein n=1 Tax=Alteribacillus persepolensis TaxID=568899 RepID=A0A1G8IKI4_9BACI|nr:hypothetical protein [Alteribacillus persepolensis]SDI19301.1 hypothetical protein SAMN05192534_12455 [Alteribacillus persepolensis]